MGVFLATFPVFLATFSVFLATFSVFLATFSVFLVPFSGFLVFFACFTSVSSFASLVTFKDLALFPFSSFSTSKVVAKKIASLVINNGLPKDTLLNVNVPKDIEGGINGYQVTRQGAIYFKDNFDKREDPRGRIYYWMSGEVRNTDNDIKSDGVAIKKGYVSITPLQLKMTNFDFIDELNDWSF